MLTSPSIAKLAAALAAAQGEITHAARDANNPHFNSRYATLASVRDACQQPFAKHGLSVLQSPSSDGNVVRCATMILHSSGEWLQSHMLQVQTRDASPQAIGSAITYLRRYQLAALAGIAPDDDDAEAAEGRPRTITTPAEAISATVAGFEAARRSPAPKTTTKPAPRQTTPAIPVSSDEIPF